jgi:general secretion pathway protein I
VGGGAAFTEAAVPADRPPTPDPSPPLRGGRGEDNHNTKVPNLARDGRGEAGFTLVEVIVALAMLSIGLGILLGLISSSLRQTANAERMAQASMLAQSLMDRVGTEWPVITAERDGQLPNGYRWHLKMLPYGDAGERDEWPVGLYTVSTEVQWEEGKERRAFALTSLRFGPRPQRR